MVKTVPATSYSFDFRPDLEPALRVAPGEAVRIETTAEPVERLFDAGPGWAALFDTRAINAVTGPVYVEGAEPGDTLAVEILDIETADWGWNIWLPGYGLLGKRAREPVLRRIPIRDGRAWLSDEISIPIQPMIGCLGVAPADGSCSTLAPPYAHAGNYDLPQMRPGNTALFPVQASGGLFSLGDLHAAMGTGEPTNVAIECAGAVTVRLSLRKGQHLNVTRIESPDRVYALGIADFGGYPAAKQAACDELFQIMVHECLLTPPDAYTVFSACVDLEFGGPAAAVVLASVPRPIIGY